MSPSVVGLTIPFKKVRSFVGSTFTLSCFAQIREPR